MPLQDQGVPYAKSGVVEAKPVSSQYGANLSGILILQRRCVDPLLSERFGSNLSIVNYCCLV